MVIDILGDDLTLQEQLQSIHDSLRDELPEIDRVAVAVYDRWSDVLKTFVHSTGTAVPFSHYEARLADVPSLTELARSRQPRVVDDLASSPQSTSPHNRLLVESGYRSSYTAPFFDQGMLFGFLFFDSKVPGYFSPAAIAHLTLYARLIGLMIIHAMAPAGMLRSAVAVAKEVSHMRDAETGAHQERMARYARVIARCLADQDPDDAIDDEFVEFVFLFAPLHDVGKIGIPDHILLKPGRLTAGEFEVMKTHVAKGVEIVDRIAESFGVRSAQHIDILRNIVQFHHEAFDGSGYLEGRAGDRIPLEARVVTVADVFDALTSRRPYKDAWSNDDAFARLGTLAGAMFDPSCVDALVACRPTVERIQVLFGGTTSGFDGTHEAYLEDV